MGSTLDGAFLKRERVYLGLSRKELTLAQAGTHMTVSVRGFSSMISMCISSAAQVAHVEGIQLDWHVS